MQGLTLVADHVDLRFHFRGVLLIGPEDDADEVGNVIARLMRHSMLLLKLRCHPDMLLAHYDIVVGFCEDPPDSLECQPRDDSVQMRGFLSLEDLEASVCALLFGFVKGLHDDSDAAFVARILSVVTI